MKETPRNRKQKPSPSLTTAGEERETPRRLKIKPRNLKEKQEAPKEKPRRYSKENSSSYPQVTEKLRNLKIKPNNLEEKAPSSSARVENHIFNFRLDVQRTNQVTRDKYYKYQRQLEESEGFYVEDCNLGMLEDDLEGKLFPCPDMALAVSAAKFALRNHNKDKGKKLSLVRVVRAMMQLVDGYNLWITLEASDHCLYEAHAFSEVCQDDCAVHSLYFFRPAKFKQRFESDMDVDDLDTDSYKDFSEFVNMDCYSFGDRRKYHKYLDQLMNSECFDVDDWGLDAWVQLVKPCSDMALAKSAAVFALKKHNKEKLLGENLKLESVVRATEHKGDSRKNLWITLKASDHGFYEAKTFSKVLNLTAVHSLDFFRPAKYYSNSNV